MLSSLSSFLPTALQGNQEPKEVPPLPATTNQREEVDAQKPSDNMGSVKKKVKKDKSANETFIFVRPPPAKSNHPLNLQVQLVPPSSRGDRSSGNRQSLDGSSAQPPEQQERNGADLSRSDSARSTDGSVYSAFTSNASISSYSSAGSTSGRRMIIPLYNLQAHNVMTNTIVDAGTDAKVAKFQKRGLEVIGLAILEPVEVWGEAPIIAAASARTSVDDSVHSHKEKEFNVLPPTPSIRPDTPSSSGDRSQLTSPTSPVTDPSLLSPNMPPSGSKKMFGKFFKRNQTRPPSMILAQSHDTSSPRSSTVGSSSRLGRSSSLSTSKTTPPPSATLPSALSVAGPDTPISATGLRPPVLGVQPTMSSPSQPPHGRPSKYVWVVRRWLKGSEGSILGGMMGKLSANGKDALGLGAMGFSMMSGMGQVEVRFEWTRGVTKRKREKHSKDNKGANPSATTAQGANGNQSHRISITTSQSSKEYLATPTPSKKDKRLSGLSQRSASTHTGTSDEQEHQEEDGDESDPEDSDTPWTCSISVQRVPPSSARQSSMSRPSTATSPSAYQQQQQLDQGVRLKVATLSPTPHHPKVVSMLKVPFPLPDIEVDKMSVRRRILTPSGIARPGTSTGHEGLILTAEEIKDVVSCTGLWLVVREGFGGVGRVSRKGDGWRIRG